MSITIRKAAISDFKAIEELLFDLNLHYPGIRLPLFWVMENSGQMIGIAQLDPVDQGYYLSAFGICKSMQRKGYGAQFLLQLQKKMKLDIYLHTVLPEFFAELGGDSVQDVFDFPKPDQSICKKHCNLSQCRCMHLAFTHTKFSCNEK